MKIVCKALCAWLLTAIVAFAANTPAEEAYNRGYAAGKRGDYTEAINQFTQAIKLDPGYARAYTARGIAYTGLHDYSKAIPDYSQAIKFNPNDVDAYSFRAYAYVSQKDFKTATADARKACELGDCEALQSIRENGLLRD
jgi:Flp pilus assembly protein TadD